MINHQCEADRPLHLQPTKFNHLRRVFVDGGSDNDILIGGTGSDTLAGAGDGDRETSAIV